MRTYVQIGIVVVALLMTGCASLKKRSASDAPARANNNSTAGNYSSATDVEKIKPAAGTGNVQGKVLFNSKPAENIEVRLCEKFNRFIGGCDGQKYVSRSD